MGRVKEAERRRRVYELKLEEPKPGEVYHTKLKHVRRLITRYFLDMTTCFMDAQAMTLEYYRKKGWNPVDLSRLQRAFLEWTKGKDFMERCTKYFADVPKEQRKTFCDSILTIVEAFFKLCCTYVEKRQPGIRSRLVIRGGVELEEEV